MTDQATRPSLYERLGGEAAVMAAVDIFYDKVLDDPLLAPHFAKLDMKRQVQKQIAFMSWAFGAAKPYEYRPLGEAHRALVQAGVSHAHFDAVVAHLRATLDELMVAPALVDEVITLVESTRGSVLGG
jgi:hemoglobin